MWEKLEKDLKIEVVGATVKKANKTSLDKFEQQHKFMLPLSYRQFVLELGPGELSEYFRIYAPGYGKQPADLDQHVSLMGKAADTFIETYGDPKLITRMMPFADSIGGDVFVWDPQKSTDTKTHEYQIAMLADEGTKPVVIAETFTAFVNDVCLDKKFGKLIRSKSWQPVRVFKPFAK